MDSLRKRQSCFIAMPFDKKYDQIFYTIVACVKLASYRCIRIDQQHFTESIIEKILVEIRNAKLLVFLATDQNSNTFYECGYAVALNKEIITLTDTYKNLPFDIRDRNSIAYGKDLKKLKSELMDKLYNLTLIPSQ